MTLPYKTLGVYKSLEDIKADFLMDLKEDRNGFRRDTWAALRGSLGFGLVDAVVTTVKWEMEHYDDQQN